MLTILRKAEPQCLADTRHRLKVLERETGKPSCAGDWDELGECIRPVREALHAEQHGLCAYCMARIQAEGYYPGSAGTKVEHSVPRSVDPDQMFDWPNLLAVCGGRYGAERTCDEARGAHPLGLNPKRREGVTELFRYDPRGRISSDNRNAKQAIDVLRLNANVHVENRARARRAVARRLRKGIRRKQLVRWLSELVDPQAALLEPYAGAIVYYLRKKIRTWGGS